MISKPIAIPAWTYIFLFFMFAFLVVGFATTSAEQLNDKFFPRDSPWLAGYAPSDFLPVGVFIFLVAGWGCVRFARIRLTSVPRVEIVIFVVIATGYIMLFLINERLWTLWQESDYQAVWADYFSELVQVWANSWLVGGMVALYIHPLRYLKTE